MRYPFLRNDPGGDVDIEIAADGLCFANEAGRSDTIEWKSIRRISLFCGTYGSTPVVSFLGQDRPSIYCCEVRLRDGRRFLIASGMKDAAGGLVDFAGQYRDFVLQLHEKLSVARSRTRFRSGLGWLRFLGWFFLEGMGWVSVGSVGFPAFFLTHSGRAGFLMNLPRRYRPGSIPRRLLPPMRQATPAQP